MKPIVSSDLKNLIKNMLDKKVFLKDIIKFSENLKLDYNSKVFII